MSKTLSTEAFALPKSGAVPAALAALIMENISKKMDPITASTSIF